MSDLFVFFILILVLKKGFKITFETNGERESSTSK